MHLNEVNKLNIMENRKLVLPQLTKNTIRTSSVGSEAKDRRSFSLLTEENKNLSDSQFSDQNSQKIASFTRIMPLSSAVSSKSKIGQNDSISSVFSNKSVPKPPSEKFENSSIYESSNRQLKDSFEIRSSRSKSPRSANSNRKATHSPIRASQQFGHLSQKLGLSKGSMNEVKEIPNPREQLAELIMQIQKKDSMPIPVEKHYKDNRVLLKPCENPPDDPSGTIIVTTHGIFEIPKEKNAPSKFTSKKEFIMESYFKDVFSKLPLVVNFTKRKMIAKWLREARKAHYGRKRDAFATSFWMSSKFFARNIPVVKDNLWRISEIIGVEVKEAIVYGKRHTEFAYRQQVCLTESAKNFERSSAEIIDAMSSTSDGLTRLQKKEREEFVDKQITDKLEGKKDNFVGVFKNKTKDIREGKIRLQGILNDGFFHYVRLAYLAAVSDMIEHTYLSFSTKMCGLRKPKFEVIMVIKDNLNVEPDLDQLRDMLLMCPEQFTTMIFTNRQIIQIQSTVFSSFKLQKPLKSTYNVYIDHILTTKGNTKAYQRILETEVAKDIDATKKVIEGYLHLVNIKKVGERWVSQLKDKNFDVVTFYKENYEQFNAFSAEIDEITTFNSVSGIISMETATIRSQLQEIPKLVISSLKERLLEILSQDASELKNELFKFHNILEEKASNLPQFAEQVTATSAIKASKQQDWEKRLIFITECANLCRKENVRIPANTIMTIDEAKSIVKSIPGQIIKAEHHYQSYGNHFEDQMNIGSAKLAKKIKKFVDNYIQRYLIDVDRFDQPDMTLKELTKREEALATMKQRVELIETYYHAICQLRSRSALNAQLKCREQFDSLFSLHCDALKL